MIRVVIEKIPPGKLVLSSVESLQVGFYRSICGRGEGLVLVCSVSRSRSNGIQICSIIQHFHLLLLICSINEVININGDEPLIKRHSCLCYLLRRGYQEHFILLATCLTLFYIFAKKGPCKSA